MNSFTSALPWILFSFVAFGFALGAIVVADQTCGCPTALEKAAVNLIHKELGK